MTIEKVPGTAALQKSFNILRLVANSENTMTLTQLQHQTGFPKGTLHRIVQALINEGLIRYREQDRSYHLGLTILQFASKVLDDYGIRDIAHSELVNLRNKTDELVHLALPGHTSATYIDSVESHHPVGPARWIVGSSSEYHCSAVGKAIASHLPDTSMSELLRRLTMKKYTASTVTSRKKLKAELELIRERGFAHAFEEEHIGINGIAAPVFDFKNQVCAAVCVTIPSYRFNPEKTESIATDIVNTANHISSAMGTSKNKKEKH